MNDILANQLDMVKTCITLANRPENTPVWQGQPPLDFAADLARLEAGYTAARALAMQADTDTTGDTDEKAAAEDRLEYLALQLARALSNHFKKTGNPGDRAKVNIPKRALVRLRDQALITKTTEIRDLALQARDESGAAGRGVTTDKINALTAASKRRELTTQVAALLEQTADLDDLVAQMDATVPGRAFIAAWKQARIIIDAGHGPSPEEPPTPPAPPAP
ncbi:MAG: hypothetical protein RL088_779 [Verrucomicrobiota bacterium]|jgi:hypothetical protein